MRENLIKYYKKELEKAIKADNQEEVCKIRAKMLKWK